MTQIDERYLDALRFRCIGPPRGGRVLAVAGHPSEKMTFYFGACAGGVWKTEDGGTYWANTSDGYLGSAAVGALAIAESDPNVIYVGMGEATIRGDVSYGDGVYKSTDGGASWQHLGLDDTNHIAKIRVHPKDPDIVYVAALGHGFGPNEERGVYRSKDGGCNWQKVLFRSDKAGAVDLTMDPNNPRILYAAIYETYRTFWTLSSGGPDSSLYRSNDGGDTWTEITDKPGLPGGLKGKIGVAVSPARAGRVWAIIEAEGDKAGLYRSDNGGEKWEMVCDNRDLIHRPWYYCHVFADPCDPETVYILNLKMWKSDDGGRNFVEITTPHGDNHDLWIDPEDPHRMVQGNDGGACVSFNRGGSWSTIYNQVTSQFYHVAADNQYPYRVYGTQQDNSSISVPSATEKGAIGWADCYPAGTGESGYIAVHPDDPNIVYVGAVGSSPGGGGALQRYDHRTKQIRLVTVWPEAYTGWGAGDLKYRFAWTFPIVFSPHDPGILYCSGNHVFRSTDEGSSWQIISPDLSRHEPETLKASGGPLTLDTSGAEHYGTVFAFAESPHTPGVFWAGSDDGLLHISRDNGENWQLITPPYLPEWSLISIVEPSPHQEGKAYLAATRYKLDDYGPYLFCTEDFGQSWRRIDGGFPPDEISRVVREDPVQPGLLYVGTESGIFFSIDDGESWQRLQSNLPVVPVYDMVIKDGDLVVGTHGRSFWILDDLTPLRAYAAAGGAAATRLLAPRSTVRQWQGWSVGLWTGPGKSYMLGLGASVTYEQEQGAHGEQIRLVLDGGENPPFGAIIYYTLPEETPDTVELAFLTEDGEPIRSFYPRRDQTPTEERTMPTDPGLNRFVWDLRYPDVTTVPGDITMERAATGPRIAPGSYRVRLTVGQEVSEQTLEIVSDPRVAASQADLDAQFELASRIAGKLDETHRSIIRLRRIRDQVDEWARRAESVEGAADVVEAAGGLREKFNVIERELIQTESRTPTDRLRLRSRLNARLGGLISVVAGADAAPPQQAYDVYDNLAEKIDEQLAFLDGVVGDDLDAFMALVEERAIPSISA